MGIALLGKAAQGRSLTVSFHQGGYGMAVDQEKGIDMEVLEDEMLYELFGLGHLLFGGGHGDVKFPGDGLIIFSLAAGEVDIPAGGGQAVYGGLQEFLVLPVLYPVAGIVYGSA